jgi:hypothetical protein
METRAFAPLYGPNAGTAQGGTLESITVTATNASATASAQFSGNAGQNAFCQIRVANKTSAWAHVAFGQFGNVEAATVADDFPVAPGAVEIFSVPSEVSGASVILDAAPGTATAVIFTRGEGL